MDTSSHTSPNFLSQFYNGGQLRHPSLVRSPGDFFYQIFFESDLEAISLKMNNFLS